MSLTEKICFPPLINSVYLGKGLSLINHFQEKQPLAMLKKKRQEKRFKAIGGSMRTHLRAFFETRNPEALHHFRIQVKKMKALLMFLQTGSKDFYQVNLLKSLQSIYKHSGRIRSAYINICLFEQYSEASPDYKLELEIIKKNEIGQFCAKRGSYTKTIKLIRKALSEVFNDIEDKYVLGLYKKQIKKLTRFFNQPNEPIDEWHKARKKIKNLLYLYKILPKSLAQKLHLNVDYLDQLQDAFGKWHDVVLVLELLKVEGHSKGNVTTSINREKRNLYRSIQTLTDNFAQKADKNCPPA